jgi:hypothetical protein
VAKDKTPSKEQRQEAGKFLREKCPRGSHGEVILGQGEKRDVVALIEESNEDRLENLVPIRMDGCFNLRLRIFAAQP